MKSLIVGASLVIVGAIVGFGLSTKNQCPKKGKKACAKMQQECMYQKPHHGGHGEWKNDDHHCKKGKKDKSKHFKQMLVNELALTAEQTTAVEKLFEAKKELRKEKRDEQKENMRAAREKTHTEIKALLTAEQKIKFDSILEKNSPRSK